MPVGRVPDLNLPSYSSCTRRRKVRCNERRPRCAHCERLNLDCTWNRPPASRSNTTQTLTPTTNTDSQATGHPQTFNPNLLALDGFAMSSNSFFEFSGPLSAGTWDEAMLLSPNSWPSNSSVSGPSHQMEAIPQPIYHMSLGHQSSAPVIEATRGSVRSVPDRGLQQSELASTSPLSVENAPTGTIDDQFLLNTFLQMLMPPILTPIEVGPKWATTRAFFGAMAAESLVVRSAIIAFAAMQMQRSGLGTDVIKTDWRPLYDNAARHLSSALAKRRKEEQLEDTRAALKYILASLFLLTYTDVSTAISISRIVTRFPPQFIFHGTRQMATNTCTATY
jgi:hypothetical protein